MKYRSIYSIEMLYFKNIYVNLSGVDSEFQVKNPSL